MMGWFWISFFIGLFIFLKSGRMHNNNIARSVVEQRFDGF
jgi:TM2 domain-containing membrane protein YozV